MQHSFLSSNGSQLLTLTFQTIYLSFKMANIETPIPSIELNDGTSMPMLAFGTGTAWYKTGDESKLDQATIDSVKTAIKLGYTHLDGAESMAPVYSTSPNPFLMA
jgi:hypothetical protein